MNNIKAQPNALGGQIDLSWKNPLPDEFPNFKGVKIVRRERRYPEISPPRYSPDMGGFDYDGTLVYDNKGESFSDTGLRGETVYYYSFYAYDDNPEPARIKHFTSRASRVAAMATSYYGLSDELYRLIPAIYKRYDTVYPEPGAMAPEDEQKGELQRFLEIFGPQLDLIKSFITATRKFLDLDECDGALLPLLAQWIGWEINLSLDLNSQRSEIRYAPELYKTIGIVANLRAIINRLSNWDSQIKEFVHNVFVSNEPEQLTIWSKKLVNGNWSDSNLVSLDFAYEGAPTVFKDSEDRTWLFYHTKRDDQWDIWYKIFDNGRWLPGYRVTRSATIDKYPSTLETSKGDVWLFWSSCDSKTWNIKTKILAIGRDTTKAQLMSQKSEPFALAEGSTLVIGVDGTEETAVTFRAADFSDIGNASCPEVVNVLNRDLPSITASLGGGNTIQLTSNTVGGVSSLIIDVDSSTAASSLGFGASFPNVEESDREPSVFEDSAGHIWLFWSSRRGGNWDIWYNKFDGTSWGAEKRFTSGLAAEREPSGVFFDAADPNRKIWLFWSRKTPDGWNVFYRTKPNTALDDTTWNPEEVLSPIPSGQKYDNREPAVTVDSQGNILVFWSSNRTGSWNIWSKIFDKTANDWTDEAQATSGHFTKKAPAVVEDEDDNIWLLFRSNESIAYSSSIYPSTTTIDSRYSGSTTIDVRNRERIGEGGKLGNVMHFTYDTGKENEDYYARDTIGIYFKPHTDDRESIERRQEIVKGVLKKFLPIQLRAVFIKEPVIFKESQEIIGPSIKDIHRDNLLDEGNNIVFDSGWVTGAMVRE
ncbi:MAG: phage tail protein [Candidatus Hodarchaeota archaeon]